MGKISFVDYPNQANDLKVGDDILDIEGDKAVVTLKSPVAGQIAQRNPMLGKQKDKLNQPDPQVNWIMKILQKK
mgnify:CR=1 FL=1